MANTSREKLLDIAFEEIFVYGYQAANTTQILKKAGMNKGSMYHFFKNKYELGIAVVDERVRKRIINKYGRLENIESDYIEKLCFFLEDTNLIDIKRGCPLNNLTQEMGSLDENYRKILQEIYDIMYQAFYNLLRRAKKEESIKEHDTDALAAYIITSIEGAIMTAKLFQSKEAYSKNITILTQFLRSLQK